ncbi:hypothetical protein QO002_004059 [Pararhizobium capsulatum DSM 1112]|uniref:Uncharacterized protein n=1 Tax=Pararhizobium capsulatum DSM 1112 TaxID=1121113 RepID=A0ABU0BW78_9HYPH|nr:hypothetical protein [Pararhizobium capsulatum]MDQ0321921.1 hypothetical protein [Pararhizobium capsulatum DSM 1112]
MRFGNGGAAAVKSILKKIRLPRKVMFVVAGVLLLSGASGAYALFMVQGKGEGENAEISVSGLACTTVDTLKMRRNGQRWIRKYINVEKGTGEERVRTALRVAGLLVHYEKADLYQVAVLDTAGPKERADWRGSAIGAQVLFAPDPKAVPGMNEAFSARYSDAPANMIGLYYGQEVSLSQDQIKDTLTSIIEKTECMDPPLPEGAEGSEAGAHGEASEHGSAEAAGQGEENGHAAEASEEGRGDKATEDHGKAAAEEHGAENSEKSGGVFASITGMIFGSSEEKPEAAEPAPVEGHEAPAAQTHGEAAPTEEHSAVKPEEHAETAKPGMLDSVKAMIFGGGEAPAGEHAAAPAENSNANAHDMTAEAAETKKEPTVH